MKAKASRNRLAVIGAGSWGTAIANHLALKGYLVNLWAYEEEVVEEIAKEHTNRTFLPDVKLPKNLKAFYDIKEAIQDVRDVFFIVPAQYFRSVLSQLLASKINLIVGTKGIEVDSLKLMSQIAEEVMPHGWSLEEHYACFSGPSFAREVTLKKPTAITVASLNKQLAEKVQLMLVSKYMRVYTCQDIVGTQLGGALKNVIALASGISDGLDLGANGKAALVTRGLAEIERLGKSLGARLSTFNGLAGIGDLFLTCSSTQSRNYSVGLKLGKGYSLDQILKEMEEKRGMVAEGVETIKAVVKLAQQKKVEVPIANQVYDILYNQKDPRRALEELMSRTPKEESK